MRRVLRWLVIFLLKPLAKGVVRKYQPRVVAITGSIGKTSAKEFTAAMLAERFRIRASAGNYNNELGVPLTVLGQRSGTSPTHWLRVFRRGLALRFGKHDYPEVLVLEMGADKPGDIGYLTSIARPDIALVTNVGNAHLEHYDSLEDIAGEKSQLVGNLKTDGIAVLNFDDTRVRIMQALAPGRVMYYGFTDESHVWVDHIKQTQGGLTASLHLREREDGQTQTWPLKTALIGQHQLYGVMAAFCVAYAAGVVPEHALAVAATLSTPPGRLKVFGGQHQLTILDDSYNASPESMLAALAVLGDFPKPHWAILGDMLELGKVSEAGHRTAGEVGGKFLDGLVVVGDRAAQIADAAKEAGMDPAKIWFASEASQAATLLMEHAKGGTVLVKASRAMHLERAVKDLLLDPRDADRLVKH